MENKRKYIVEFTGEQLSYIGAAITFTQNHLSIAMPQHDVAVLNEIVQIILKKADEGPIVRIGETE